MIQIPKTSEDHKCLRCEDTIPKGSKATFELVGVSHIKEECNIKEHMKKLDAEEAYINQSIANQYI